jgi:hypothetical protein
MVRRLLSPSQNRVPPRTVAGARQGAILLVVLPHAVRMRPLAINCRQCRARLVVGLRLRGCSGPVRLLSSYIHPRTRWRRAMGGNSGGYPRRSGGKTRRLSSRFRFEEQQRNMIELGARMRTKNSSGLRDLSLLLGTVDPMRSLHQSVVITLPGSGYRAHLSDHPGSHVCGAGCASRRIHAVTRRRRDGRACNLGEQAIMKGTGDARR